MKRKEVVFHAKPSDVRHIWINCRCGERSESLIPIQAAKAHNLHICPKCGAAYEIRLQLDGNTLGLRKERWQIERRSNLIQDTELADHE